MDVLRKEMDENIATAQDRYKRNFYRAVRRTPPLYVAQHVSVDRVCTQMTETEGMANALLTKLLSKTMGLFKVMSATLDIVIVDEDGTYSTVSIGKVMVAPYNAHDNDGTV